MPNKTEGQTNEAVVEISDAGMLENQAFNLKALTQAIGVTQSQMAKMVGVSSSTFSTYINGKTLALVSSLASIRKIGQEKGLRFTIDEFLFQHIRFGDTVEPVAKKDDRRDEYLGAYYLYFFAQTSAGSVGVVGGGRPLRYGVMSAYRQKRLMGEDGLLVRAKFFKEMDAAVRFRKELDAAMKVQRKKDESEKDREADSPEMVLQLYEGDNEAYKGEITFTDKHVFLELSSSSFGDKALAIFALPPKKEGAPYIGGLGNMVSVTHGRNRLPTTQRLIMSRVLLNASQEMIGDRLRAASGEMQMQEQAEDLLELYKRLYPAEGEMTPLLAALDDHDKTAIFCGRLRKLVTDAADRHFNSVSAVSGAEDWAVYELIQASMNADRGE